MSIPARGKLKLYAQFALTLTPAMKKMRNGHASCDIEHTLRPSKGLSWPEAQNSSRMELPPTACWPSEQSAMLVSCGSKSLIQRTSLRVGRMSMSGASSEFAFVTSAYCLLAELRVGGRPNGAPIRAPRRLWRERVQLTVLQRQFLGVRRSTAPPAPPPAPPTGRIRAQQPWLATYPHLMYVGPL